MPPRERNTEVSKAFGRALRAARKRQKLTQAEAAELARVDRGSWGRIERGEREPALSVLVRSAEALGLRAWELLQAMEAERGEREGPPPSRLAGGGR